MSVSLRVLVMQMLHALIVSEVTNALATWATVETERHVKKANVTIDDVPTIRSAFRRRATSVNAWKDSRRNIRIFAKTSTSATLPVLVM